MIPYGRQEITQQDVDAVVDVLRSDFLLVKIDNRRWLPFRDVFERDGRPVRDRQDRLTKLFLGGATNSALVQAEKIMNESARYNIGNGTRTINVPRAGASSGPPSARPRPSGSSRRRARSGSSGGVAG